MLEKPGWPTGVKVDVTLDVQDGALIFRKQGKWLNYFASKKSGSTKTCHNIYTSLIYKIDAVEDY